MIKRMLGILLTVGLVLSVVGCYHSYSSDQGFSNQNGYSQIDSRPIAMQVGHDTELYYSCQELDCSFTNQNRKDESSQVSVYGGMIAEDSVWVIEVISETDDSFVYLQEFDLTGNPIETIKLGSFTDIDLGYDSPYFECDSQSITIIAYPSSDHISICKVDKQSHSVKHSMISLEDAYYGEMLGVRNGNFYMRIGNSQGEVSCRGYDLDSGTCKFQSEPDAEAETFVWFGEKYYQLNRTSEEGKFEVFELSDGKVVSVCGTVSLPAGHNMIRYQSDRQYIYNDEGIWCLNENDGTWENLIKWKQTDMFQGDFMTEPCSVSEDAKMILKCGREMKNVNLLRVASDLQSEKTELCVLGDCLSEGQMSAIQEFNRTNPDCVITYQSFEDILDSDCYLDTEGWIDYDAYDQALSEYLWKAILQGDGPDIIIRSQSSGNDALSSRFYEYGGLFLDMWPLWEKEDKLWRGQFFANLIDCTKNGESLFTMPLRFTIESDSILDPSAKNTEATYSSWLEYMKTEANGRTFMSCTGEDFLEKCLTIDYLAFLDESQSTSMFSCQEFKELLQLSKDYCYTQDEWNSGNYRDSLISRVRLDGQTLPWVLKGVSYESNGRFCDLVTRSAGHASFTFESISITSCCNNVDGAWAFVKLLMSAEYQSYDMHREAENIYLAFIPVNCESFEEYLDFFIHPQQHEAYWKWQNDYVEDGSTTINWADIAISEEDGQILRDYVSSIDYVRYTDYEILNVVMEEAKPYFSGQKSADEVVAIIDNRVQTILDERQ